MFNAMLRDQAASGRFALGLRRLGRFSLCRWVVETVSIRCVNCGGGWTTPTHFSVYEQQAQESCPCPFCGAYTLCCAEAEADRPRALARPDVRAF